MKIPHLLFAPDDDKGGGITTLEKPEVFDDDTTLLDNLIDNKPGKPEKEDEELEEEKPEEGLDILDDELKPDEDLIIDTNARALDFKKIKEKYSDFAKTNEYRELRNAYHRESQYTELFPTIEDAKEAAENNETYNKLNNDIINNGDIFSLLNSIKEAAPQQLTKIASSFLDAISKIDGNLYVATITPVVVRLAKQINNAGKNYLKRNAESVDGQALVATARNIIQYAFPDTEDANRVLDKDDVVTNEPSEKEKELAKRENAIAQEKWQSAYNICAQSVDKNLDKAIIQGLDPDNKLNDFTRDTLIEKIKTEVMNQISKDELHVRRMSSLWKRATTDGYNRESLSRIVSAYLERARPIIPAARNKFRSMAIKGGRERDDSDESIHITPKGRSGRAPERDGKVSLKNVDPKKIDYSKTSTDDIFEGKVKLRS